MTNTQENNKFDFFKWEAPYYKTTKEVNNCLQSINLVGKTIKDIKVIGHAFDMPSLKEGDLFRTISRAGIKLDDDWEDTYEYIDDVLLPWQVQVCEPLQLIFDDNSTLEIMPIGKGGARIGLNSIPIDVIDGLNSSNFDAHMFFNEAIGKEIESIDVYEEIDTKIHYSRYSYEKNKEHEYEEKSAKYKVVFDLKFPIRLCLKQDLDSWFYVSMYNSCNREITTYSRFKEYVKETEQVIITNGIERYGSAFSIYPISKNKDECFCDNFDFSIADYDIDEFLRELLIKYYDPKIQEYKDRCDDDINNFDDYGANLYSIESIKKMIAEIKDAIVLLENDADNQKVRPLINGFVWWEPSDKNKDQFSEEEIFEKKKERIPVAIDFYKRFILRIESILEALPNIETISFCGP